MDALTDSASLLIGARRLVIKIGSAMLVDGAKGALRDEWLKGVALDIVEARGRGADVLVVSSGSIALGRHVLKLGKKALSLEEAQAAAAVGQIRLAQAFQEALAPHGLIAAQVLVTLEDTRDRRRYLNGRATLKMLLSLGAVPIINENDTVATDEIRFGDNDRLAARVALMAGADVLVLLSDVDGLYDGDPRTGAANRFDRVTEITPEIEAMAKETGGEGARGGMRTKILAAKTAMQGGCAMAITRGDVDRPLTALANGARCTWFQSAATPLLARKQWIASMKPAGRLIVDAGAANALRSGKSLLPAGVRAVEGSFERGDPVAIVTTEGLSLGAALVGYSAEEGRAIAGRKSAEIETILGYAGRAAMAHRDDMVIWGSEVMDGRDMDVKAVMAEIGRAAKAASRELAYATDERKHAALIAAADAILERRGEIEAANARDMEYGRGKGLSPAMLDRLMLDENRIRDMANGLRAVADQPDPVGRVIDEWDGPSGIHIKRVRTPLGVIGVIYESRPNVTADAGGLCLKSGNAAILRGGSESFHSSTAIHACLVEGLKAAKLPEHAIQLVPTRDRAAVGEMLTMTQYIDVIVPRGGKGLVGRVQADARVPVFAHLEGICHIYVDKTADLAKARAVIVNAKTRRTGICGAAECLLIDRALLPDAPFVADLLDKGVEVRGDAEVQALDARVKAAGDDDWGHEFLDMIIAARVVDGVDAAIAHIQTYGSNHTDCVLTEDDKVAARFFERLDSAILMRNASTQFADGGEFGMGAEIGIATGKMHARGPVGAVQLTSFKYLVEGDGTIRP